MLIVLVVDDDDDDNVGGMISGLVLASSLLP